MERDRKMCVFNEKLAISRKWPRLLITNRKLHTYAFSDEIKIIDLG